MWKEVTPSPGRYELGPKAHDSYFLSAEDVKMLIAYAERTEFLFQQRVLNSLNLKDIQLDQEPEKKWYGFRFLTEHSHETGLSVVFESCATLAEISLSKNKPRGLKKADIIYIR